MTLPLREHFTGLDPLFGQVDIEQQGVEGGFVFIQPTSQGGFPQRHRKASSFVPKPLQASRMKPGPWQCTLKDSPGSTALQCSDAFCALQMSFTEPEHKAAPNKMIITSFLTPASLISIQAVVYHPKITLNSVFQTKPPRPLK